MLPKETFIAGIGLLTKCYIGWGFNINDDIQVGLWYSAFKNLTKEQFISVVNEYMSNNDYPPKCIKNLTDIIVRRYIAKAKLKPEKAFDTIRSIVGECGGWEYGRKDIYKKLEAYPTLLETVNEFEDTLKYMSANDPYTADRFRKAYEANLIAAAKRRVDKDLGLALPTGDKQALGSGTLPYEQ